MTRTLLISLFLGAASLVAFASKTDDIVQAFFKAHWKTLANNEPSLWVSQFADSVQVGQSENTTREKLRIDRSAFIKIFPVRDYQLLGSPQVDVSQGRLDLTYRYNFTFSGEKTLTGTASVTCGIKIEGNRLYVDRFVENFDSGIPVTADGLPEVGYFNTDEVFSTSRLTLFGKAMKTGFLKRAQYALLSKGVLDGEVSDDMNTRVQQSILAFQRDNKLKPSGLLDESTLDALGVTRTKELEALAFNRSAKKKINIADYEGALADYAQAILLSPKDPVFFSNRGYVKCLQGDFNGAIEECNSAIRLDPLDSPSFFYRSQAKIKKKDYAGAIEDCNRALALNPDYTDAYYNRANAYQKSDDHSKAIADFTETISLNPKDVTAYWERAISKLSKQDNEGTIEDCTRALTIDPNFADAYSTRGQSHMSKQQFSEAIDDFSKAFTLKPTNPYFVFFRGNAKRKSGDNAGALEDYTKSIEINPQLSGAWANRARVKAAMGDAAGARADEQRASQLRPR